MNTKNGYLCETNNTKPNQFTLNLGLKAFDFWENTVDITKLVPMKMLTYLHPEKKDKSG